jgi:hypothetical protein
VTRTPRRCGPGRLVLVLVLAWGLALFPGLGAAQAGPTSPAARLVSEAFPGSTLESACRVSAGAALRNAFAVALRAPDRTGYYAVVSSHRPPFVIAIHDEEAPEVQCFSLRQAHRLHGVLQTSEGIHGEIRPTGNGTVVCFEHGHGPHCWQYAPSSKSFRQVGYWVR